MVKVGDRVRISGREAKVTGRWGQGKHVAWSLDDGTTVLDLQDKVEAGDAEVLPERIVRTQPLRVEEEDEN